MAIFQHNIMRGYLKEAQKMILQKRRIGKELLYYRALSRRMKLDNDTQKSLDIHERGYQGELVYDAVYDETLTHLYVFRGVYLKVRNTIIQCDSLLVSDNGLILHEIKNYSGNYTYEDEKWLVRNFQISEDPFIQLKRATNNLLKIKYNNQINFSIEGKIIFPNIDFSLTSTEDKIWNSTIMRNQLRKYLSSFKTHPATNQAVELVEIIQSHIIDDPFFNVSTDYNLLKKGVYCRACGSFNLTRTVVHFKCHDCSHRDTIHTVTLLAIADLSILFQNTNITRQQVYAYLDGQVSLSTITKILKTYCDAVSNGPNTSYKFNYYDFDDAYNLKSRTSRYKDSPILI